MKRTWLVWTLVGGVVVTVLVAFNYERGKETVPLTEIFPDQNLDADVEYEFFDTDEKGSAPGAITQNKDVAPVAPPAPVVSSKPSVPVKKAAPATTAAQKPQPVIAPTVAAPSASTGSGKIFTIQVAAFKERAKADIAMQQAQKKGYPAYVDERSRSDGSVWYQICVGKFDSQVPAKELLTKIKEDYKDGYIKVLTGK